MHRYFHHITLTVNIDSFFSFFMSVDILDAKLLKPLGPITHSIKDYITVRIKLTIISEVVIFRNQFVLKNVQHGVRF